ECVTASVSVSLPDGSELERVLAQQSAVARLGELALRRSAVRELMDAACHAVTETLAVELAFVLEHTGAGRMQVRAGIGWEPGFVGSSFEMASYRDPSGRARYAGGPVVIADLPADATW